MARRGASVKTAARLRADEATRELREAQARRLAALGAAAQGYFEAAERRERAQLLVDQEDARAKEALRAVRELVDTSKAAAELCGVSVYEVTAAMAAGTAPQSDRATQATPGARPTAAVIATVSAQRGAADWRSPMRFSEPPASSARSGGLSARRGNVSFAAEHFACAREEVVELVRGSHDGEGG